MFLKSLAVLLFVPLFLHAQQNEMFKIYGESNYYNNRKLTVSVGVWPLIYNDCMLKALKTDTTYNPNIMVQNGKFELTGTLRYPHPLVVSYYDADNNYGHSSYSYYIDGGDLHITVDDLAKNKSLGNNINNKADQEYRRLRKFYCAVVDTLTGKISDMEAKQKLMHAYIAAHPDSYVALWELLFDYSYARNDRVKRFILENVQLLSPELKKSKTYHGLLNDLQKDLDLAVGKLFPDIYLKPSMSIKAIAKENKYTLIDFWASWCEPCLKAFPDLKKIYTSYKGMKFTIISISVDRKEDEDDWQKLIKKFNLGWPQYLDVNGKEAHKINVKKYPTTFLLDEKGVIIKKDILLEELKDFLEKKLGKTPLSFK